MSQIILLLVTGLTPIANRPPGGKVAFPQLAVIATGEVASAAPQSHLKEEQPVRVKKIDSFFFHERKIVITKMKRVYFSLYRFVVRLLLFISVCCIYIYISFIDTRVCVDVLY